MVEQWRGRLVALYGCSYALSQLSGPLLLGVIGTDHDYGFWVGVGLLVVAPVLLLGRSGAPTAESFSVTFADLWRFCRSLCRAAVVILCTLLAIYAWAQNGPWLGWLISCADVPLLALFQVNRA